MQLSFGNDDDSDKISSSFSISICISKLVERFISVSSIDVFSSEMVQSIWLDVIVDIGVEFCKDWSMASMELPDCREGVDPIITFLDLAVWRYMVERGV